VRKANPWGGANFVCMHYFLDCCQSCLKNKLLMRLEINLFIVKGGFYKGKNALIPIIMRVIKHLFFS
jgi:hypothetical protein